MIGDGGGSRGRPRVVLLAEGMLDFHHGKTATSWLRYRPDDVVAVIDSENAGRTTGQMLGLGGNTPVVADLEGALEHEPTALVIGIAPRGGGLPDEWRPQILKAMANRLDIISGLHYLLSDDREFVEASKRSGVELVDVRKPPANLGVAELLPRRDGCHVITFVGSDCAVGKMTAGLELTAAAQRLNLRACLVATGQTGIMLQGSGIAIDRVVGDFMAGAAEQLVVEACQETDWIFVEGQGSLLHPGYSGVTLALLHGSAPDALVLVHPPGHNQIDEYPVAIPGLPRLIKIYEEAAGWVKPAPVVAVALNTRNMELQAADEAIKRAEAETGLPVTDPVRYGGEKLVRALYDRLGSEASVPTGSALDASRLTERRDCEER